MGVNMVPIVTDEQQQQTASLSKTFINKPRTNISTIDIRKGGVCSILMQTLPGRVIFR